MARKRLTIAIDGPAGSGKSTTARIVAQKLGYLYLDTGAMYRALTLKVLQSGIDLNEEQTIAQLAERTRIELENVNGEIKVLLDGKDVSQEIRTPKVTEKVSAISAIPAVRKIMVRKQQNLGRKGGIVAEGRDIGTVVFPQADLKVYLVASLEERARRRQEELRRQGIEIDREKLLADLQKRDTQDASRACAPLKKANDAIELDTTHLSIDEQVNIVLEKVAELTA